VTIVPEHLAAACRGIPERMAWLGRLPDIIQELRDRWELSLGEPWTRDASCAWVAPAVRKNGSRFVLKLGMPHMEAEHEIDGLRFWNGEPTVRLLEADAPLHALLLERCEPGTSLRDVPEEEADLVLAGLLHRMWRRPSAPHVFRPLSMMVAHWTGETLAARGTWTDADLVRAVLRTFEELAPRILPSPFSCLSLGTCPAWQWLSVIEETRRARRMTRTSSLSRPGIN
jgi:streptomycin 6-kinase